MKKVQYSRYGGPKELRLDEVAIPEPGQGQVRIRVKAASYNPMDGKIRRGEMKALSGVRFPRGLGHDFAGEVDAVGPSAQRLKVGDEVFGVTSIPKAARSPNLSSRTRRTSGSSRLRSRSSKLPPSRL